MVFQRPLHAVRRACAAATLAACLVAGAPAAVPVVDVQRHGAPHNQGVSETFLGTVEGRTAVFKPNAPVGLRSDGSVFMKTGNLSGEWLGSRLMNDLGVRSPDVDMVRVRGEAVPYARVQHMQELFPGETLARGFEDLPRSAKLDLDAMRRMQVADLLIGNPDRHGRNVWFRQDPRTGRWSPIAFDHNLAMGTTASTGGERSTLVSFQERMVGRAKSGAVIPTGHTHEILGRNSVYAGIMNHPRAAHGLLAEARHVQGTLTDARIDQLVDSMPDEAIGPDDKAARRRELKEHLRRRRDTLVRATEATLRAHPDYMRAEWRLAGLPDHLKAQLPTDLESRWRFVGAVRRDGRFDPVRLEAALATSGLDGSTRREIRRHVRKQGGLPLRLRPTTSGDLAAVGAAMKTGTVRQMERVKDPYTDFTGRQKHPTYDFLEVRAGADGPEMKGLEGRTPPPEYTAVRRVAQRAQGEIDLKPGETMRVTRKPTGLQGVDVHVLAPTGEVVARSRYHTPLGRPVRTGRKLRRSNWGSSGSGSSSSSGSGSSEGSRTGQSSRTGDVSRSGAETGGSRGSRRGGVDVTRSSRRTSRKVRSGSGPKWRFKPRLHVRGRW